MAGVRHDSLADIGLISDNLRDRYKTGFPILKEIVQNADDAGASHLSFGYSSGLLNSEHELLSGPAVFFINDGPLRPSDADAILSIALGSKASNENAIGKFGLGMKSLFHLCEAFFYMSDQWASDEEFHSNIFNPWGDLRQQWELFNNFDKALIQEHLQGVLNAFKESASTKNWFIVWVPLRKRQLNGNGSIIENYPGDDLVLPDFILDKTITVHLGQLLPLLKGLNGISIWEPSKENQIELHCISTIRLNDVAMRRQFHAPIVNSKLAGKIVLEKDNEQNLIEYAGHEDLLVDERFDKIRSSEFWPKSYERNSITGKEQQVKDKAKPHLAVVICQRKVEGRASCHIDWSVFLPLGTYPQIERISQVNDDDKYDTQVFIHGYFFIDAGRVHIHGLDTIGEPLIKIESNQQVRSQWNSILATEGCLSYLPLAVKNFVEAHKCGFERTQHLSEAIYKSDFVRKYQQWICFRYQWIFQLEKDKSSWELISADLIALPLPNQPKADKSRAWTVFPKLTELSVDGYVFYDQTQVALLNKNHEGWDDNLLSKALEIDALTVFSDRILFTYLNDFLSLAEVKQTEVIKQQLFLLARTALQLSNDKWIKSELTRLLGFIPPGRCVISNKVKLNGLWAELAGVQTRVLVIPFEVAPENEQKTILNVDDAILLLEVLDKVLSNENSVKHHEEAQALVTEIISLVEPNNKERLLRDCSNFKLFKVYEVSERKDKFFAKSGLISIQNSRALFRFSSGLGADRFGHGDFLLKAIEQDDLYFFIGKDTKDLVFDKSVIIPECNDKACLDYIDFKKPLLSLVTQRTDLLNKLSSLNGLDHRHKEAFRYLLHGNLDHYNDTVSLLTVATGIKPVWEKLARFVYKTGNDDWRLIDQVLIDNLSNKLTDELDVEKLDVSQIHMALSQRISTIDFNELHFEGKEYELILSQIEDQSLWIQLPFHETLQGARTVISEQCYLDNDLDIPTALESQFKRIKKSLNTKVADQQKQWIRPLDQTALVEIILSSTQPHQHYQIILDQLDGLLGTSASVTLTQLLKSKAWLLNSDRQPIKPEDVINIEGLEDEVKRLTAACKAGYVAPDDVHLDIRQHPAYLDIEKLFSCEKQGLDCLFLMLGESNDYAIGPLNFTVNEMVILADLIADNIVLPGWRFLANKKIGALLEQTESSIDNPLTPILKPISIDLYLEVLNNLKTCHSRVNANAKAKIKKLFNAYLTILVQIPDAIELLKSIYLLNQKGDWVLPEQLCINVEGVDEFYLLDRDQANCLGSIIYSGVKNQTSNEFDFVANNTLLAKSTPSTLSTYFKDWDGHVESKLIGFFISLLGSQSEIEKVAENFLVKSTVEGVRNEIIWQTKISDGQNVPLFDNLNQHQAIHKMQFLINIQKDKTINVTSIFNTSINVSLSEKPKSLIVNRKFYQAYGVSFQLRKLDFNYFSDAELSELLKASAEFILKDVYEQTPDLEKIWTTLGESDQLDIAVARGLILDELPANLRQLSIIKQSKIYGYLQSYANAKAKQKELELTGNQTLGSADEEVESALKDMQNALKNDDETQRLVLEAIRSKISNHQYQNYSVPFELFQNADDAVFEYAEMMAYPLTSNFLDEVELSEQQTKFYLIHENDTLTFVHWGRAINYFRGGEGFPGKDRGFHRDLEKMLLMNTSDKQSENQVTGKFGLGFKSVYLISDKPRLLSGRLGVEVCAAMLPESIQETDRVHLKNKVEGLSHTHLTATVIELPLVTTIDQENILKKFEYFAGVLVVFSKTIKQIIFNHNQYVNWNESVIFNDLPEIKKGNVLINNQRKGALKFVFKDEKYPSDLLFLMGASGFEAFPHKINQEILPKIWILAPTHDESFIGFLINSGFDVDMGRMQLAHASDNNDQIMLHLGKSFVRVLEALNSLITNDWDSVSKSLSLATDMTPYKLWASLWSVLITSWISKDDNKVHQLVRLMLTSPRNSFVNLFETKVIIPNGLWGDFQQLVNLNDVKYILRGVLTEDKFFTKIDQQLTHHIEVKDLIHEDVQRDLFKLLTDEKKNALRWTTFNLSTLAEKTFTNKKVEPTVASVWGSVLTDDLLEELEKTEDRKKEKQSLDKVLLTLEFKNKAQQFIVLSDLLDSQYGEQEEKLRAAFAPDSNVLSLEYDEKSFGFFRYSRKQMKASLEDMEYWALHASDLNKQISVLRYLLISQYSNFLAAKLRLKVKGTWLGELNEQSVHFEGWEESDKTDVLKRKLATDDQMRQIKIDMPIFHEEQLKPEIVLKNVYEWWAQNKSTYLVKYSKNIYPDGVFPTLKVNGEINRDAWMILLFLASLHTVGRTQDVQHRDAIRYFKEKGWWQIFTQETPEESSVQWMSVLDQYLQDQFYGNQYDAWMMRFVTIYRFARWLEEYADIWLAINNQSVKFSLEDVLNTATSSIYAGGGVSAPRLSRALGIGANFMMRELVRNNVLNSVIPIIGAEHCFVPHLRVRKLLNELGMSLNEEHADIDQSQEIFEFISSHLDKSKATFDLSFDIPFQIISRDEQLKQQLFSNIPVNSTFVSSDSLIDAPAWAWDLSCNVRFFVELIKDNGLPEPDVGEVLCDKDGGGVLELELSWKKQKVGIVVDEDEQYWKMSTKIKELGWQVYSIDELDYILDQFLSRFL